MHLSQGQPPTSRQALIGVALVVIGICTVQGGASVAKLLFDVLSPQGMTWLRLVFAALILLAIARPRVRTWDADTWRTVLAFGATLGAMNLLYYASLATIPLAVAVTCELLGPIALALALTRRVIDGAWALLALIGVGIIGVGSISGALDPIGVCLSLAAGGCWALYIIGSKRVGERVPGLGGLAVAMCAGALVVTPFGVVDGVTAVVELPSLLVPAIGIALLSSVLPYGLELIALRRIPSRAFGVLMSLEPAAAALFGFVVVGELIALPEWVAIVLVVVASAGTAITAAHAARTRPPHPSPPDPAVA